LGKQPTEELLLASFTQLTTLIASLDEKADEYNLSALKSARNIIIDKLKKIAWDQFKHTKGITDDL